MNSQQAFHGNEGGKEKGDSKKEEERKTRIITVSLSKEQNKRKTTGKKANGPDHTLENQNQTEQIWRTIHWQCVPDELGTKCEPDESRKRSEEVENNRQDPTKMIKVKPASPKNTGVQQTNQAPSGQETPTAATPSTEVELLLVKVEQAPSKEDPNPTAATESTDVVLVLDEAPSKDQKSTAATASKGIALFLEQTTKEQKNKNDDSKDKTKRKSKHECIRYRLNISLTPPTLILYLLGNSKDFCSENNRKKEEFERHFRNCVLNTPTWVFGNSELEGYLGELRSKYSFKENESIFFFHTKDMKYNVFSELKHVSEKTRASLVFLFLNGGEDTFLATVPVALEEKIPVVAVKGSGNFADDLPRKKRSKEPKATTATTEKSEKDNREKTQSTQVDKSVEDIVADEKFKEFDLVSNFGRNSALRLSLLDAIFTEDDDQQKSDDKKNVKIDTPENQEHKLTRLALAHAWECSDKAKEMRWSKFESNQLHEMMVEALVKEQVEFVELFLDLGLNLTNFLKEKLMSLCCKEYEEKDSMFKKLSKDVNWTEVARAQPEKSAHEELKKILKDLLDDICIRTSFFGSRSKTKDETKKTSEEDPELLLFLWALLSKKFNLAKFLWRDVQDHVTTALVACILLRAMRSRTINDVRFNDEQQEITTTTELFESLAITTLNNCYKDDQTKTFQLLSRIQETEYWSDVTCLEIAERARCRKFIAQEPCQNFADRIWRGLDPFSKNEEDKTDLFLVITRFFYAISAIFVIVPKCFMDFSQNKRGPSQLRYAFGRFCFYWPRYWEDPSFKFYSGWFFFIGFLLLYAYVLMVRIPPADVHISEVALFIWFGTMHFEELRVCAEWVRPKRQPVAVFLLSQLGFLNVTNYYLAWGGIFQWLLDSSAFSLHVALCLNFISFICRLFHFLSISSQLGPKVFMIYQMIKEIVLFSVLLIIIFLTYGVIMYSIENRGHGVVNSTVVLSLPVEAFWLMLADRPQDVDESEDDPKVVFRGLLRVAYLFFTSLLLINILIAAFSNLYENINNQKEDVRKYQKFEMIVKFYLGSPLPPPLTLFYYPILYVFRCFGYDITRKRKDNSGNNPDRNKTWHENRFRLFLSEPETTTLLNWAKFTTETYTEEKPKTVEDLVKETMENNFADQDKKNEDKRTVTKEYCDYEDQYGELTEDLFQLHDTILDSTSTLNKAMTSVEDRIACHPCIIYKSCVLCGKPPGNPTYLSGRYQYARIQAENSLRRKSMPNLRKLPAPEC